MGKWYNKNMKKLQKSLFDEEERMEALLRMNDSLERLNEVIEWEKFRRPLTRASRKEDSGKGGRPAYDVMMMFKILVLQRLYNLSDDQMEYQINDRLSFMRFLGLNLEDKVPDAKTIWNFRNDLAEAELDRELFYRFDCQLQEQGLITHSGTIVDATFVEVPKQRNHRDENKQIKNGEIPEEWRKPENADKLAQKDIDARWAKKNNEMFFGYKDHVKCDADSKLITNYEVTAANVYDGEKCTDMLNVKDENFYADSAYSSAEIAENLPKYCKNHICEKGTRDHPLTEEQKNNNREKSRTRCRIEHIFGYMTNSMNGITIRSIGIKRAKFNIGFMNLVYNFCRYRFLKNQKRTMG